MFGIVFIIILFNCNYNNNILKKVFHLLQLNNVTSLLPKIRDYLYFFIDLFVQKHFFLYEE